MKIHWRKIFLMLIDMLQFAWVWGFVWAISQFMSPGGIKSNEAYLVTGAAIFVCTFLCRTFLGIYSSIWRYANSRMYISIVTADAMACICVAVAMHSSGYYIGLFTIAMMGAMVALLTLTSRFVYQIKYRNNNSRRKDASRTNVAIIGAGFVGSLLAQELSYNNNAKYNPVLFVDRDPSKAGKFINGVRIISEDDPKVIDKIKDAGVQETVIAVSNINGEELQHLIKKYTGNGFKVKVYDFDQNSVEKKERREIREINIEDLLFRGRVDMADSKASEFYKDKVVLVTGGGGSIGSEICRQVASLEPKKLIIFDIYENNAYEVQQELVRKYGALLDLSVEIGSVRDRVRLNAVMSAYRPDVVLHAAAHKHVPLMEHSACEAIKNNVLGTYNTADIAEKYGVSKFVLISTDKAVNPTNIMGASKRMCEMVIMCRRDSKTVFSAVRFGNVLGSNGSVIPLFRRQIMEGGPLTITDKRIVRYFMTISEATQLVLETGAISTQGQLFVLDMGKPVKIIDMAENMIRLSGLKPYEDIDIVEIGLRPGEKLYEELLMKSENLTKTDNKKIFIEEQAPLSREEVDDKVNALREAVIAAENGVDAGPVRDALKRSVPTYRDADEVNKDTSVAEMKDAEDKHQEIIAERVGAAVE